MKGLVRWPADGPRVRALAQRRRRRAARTVPALVLGALIISACLWWQSVTVVVERLELPIAGLPAAFDGLTIVHLSDIHGRRFAPESHLIAEIRKAAPDFIAVTGDHVNRSLSELARLQPLFETLVSIAPVYAVSGNHDHWVGWPSVAQALRSWGVRVLENERDELTRGGEILVLSGISDPVTGQHDLASAIPDPPPGPVVLLAHGAVLHQRMSESEYHGTSGQGSTRHGDLRLLERVALSLVGHTHGGQIKLPLVGAVTNASGRAFPRNYVEGLSREGAGWLYISRGLGYTIIPLRFLARPELTVITLRSP